MNNKPSVAIDTDRDILFSSLHFILQLAVGFFLKVLATGGSGILCLNFVSSCSLSIFDF
jgi:hypothetical protein